jgi:hypothetical protein
MKGIAVVAIALVAMVAILIGGFALNVLIGEQINIKQTAKEIEIVRAVNTVESIKRGLPYSLYYSYSEALRMGGYASFSQVENKNGFEANISYIFGEYRNEIEEKASIIIPGGTVNTSSAGDELSISFSSLRFLTYEYSSPEFSFKIFENPNVTIQIKDNQLIERF